jgi:hypothetical protein
MSVCINDGITSAQLRKVREAHSVTFHATKGTDSDWYGQIKLTAKDESILTLDVPVSVDAAGGMGPGNRDHYRHNFTNAYESILSARFDEEWVTTAAMLKPGDRLTLMFKADWGTSELAANAGLHVDVLSLRVMRGEPFAKGSKRLDFHIGTRVTLDNSARMVR